MVEIFPYRNTTTRTGRQYLRSIILPIDFVSDNRKIAFRGFKRIGFPGEIDGGCFDRGLKLRSSFEADHPELFLGIVVMDLLVDGFPHDPQIHLGRYCLGHELRPSWLVYYVDPLHLEGSHSPVIAERERSLRHRDHPVKTAKSYRGMKIMDLVRRGQLPLE